MKVISFEVGRMVISRQGHDKGRAFVIVSVVDERFVLIADGDTRKLAHPKKKQLKHLRALPCMATDTLCQSEQRAGTADSAIRKALQHYANTNPEGSPRADRMTNKEEYALVQE